MISHVNELESYQFTYYSMLLSGEVIGHHSANMRAQTVTDTRYVLNLATDIS